MEDKSKILRDQVDLLKVDPSDRVWNRLEQRLDQDKGKVKAATLRYWGAVAAAILLLITASTLMIFSSGPNNQLAQIELQPLPIASFASYQHVGRVNEIYSQHEWRVIEEGTKKRLRVNQAIRSKAVEN